MYRSAGPTVVERSVWSGGSRYALDGTEHRAPTSYLSFHKISLSSTFQEEEDQFGHESLFEDCDDKDLKNWWFQDHEYLPLDSKLIQK